jgi:HK97 family phage major capsid protein
MKKSDLFKQERKEARNRLKELEQTAEAESRDYTAAEETAVRAELDGIEALDGKIALHERTEAQAVLAAAATGSPVANPLSKGDKRDMNKFSFVRFLRNTNSNKPLEGIEREMHEEAEVEMRAAGQVLSPDSYGIPMALLNARFSPSRQKRAMTAGVDTAGGFSVETSVDGYVEALRERNILLSNGAEMMSGLTGNIQMPRENAVFNPVWEGEVDEDAESQPSYTDVTFSPKRLGGHIDLSNQLLVQNSSSIEARVMSQILKGHAIALDKAGFNGTGTLQPTGIINDSDVTVIAVGANGGAITDAILLSLEEAVDLANGDLSPAMYAVTPKLRRALKSIKVDDGSGLFLWDRLTNTVNSYGAMSTNNLPANLTKGSGTALNAMVFGDFSGCSFGQWGGLEILRDPYTQARKGTTRLVLNALNDFHVLQPGNLAACKDLTV